MNRVLLITILSLVIFTLSSSVSLSQDVTPPVFEFFEPQIDMECSDLDEITVTATDDSGDPVTITYSDQEFSGGCVPNIYRTYYATDSSGNVSEAFQLFLMDDLTPPIFMGTGGDMIMSCEEAVPSVPNVIVYDECQEEEIEDFDFEEVISESLCETVITWTWTAVDFCGNMGSHTKTITIVDETAPEFSDEPEDLFAFCSEGYPEIPELSAADNCNDVTITYAEETVEGGMGAGEAAYCTAEDVSYNNSAFSLLLIDSPAQEEYSTSDLVFMQMPDLGDGSSAVLSGNIYGVDNPDAGWFVYMEFENGIDWEEWSNQEFPASYKDDFDIAGNNYLDWTYFIMNSTNSQLTGLGDYAGSELILSHTPSNYYFGFQLGEAANNYSTDYGFGGWFHAEGLFMDSSSSDSEIVEGVQVSHAGDVVADLTCCPLESQVRTWTATDACGNSSSVDQVITLIDVMSPEFTFVPEDLLLECGDDVPTELAEATDSCSDVTITFEDEVVETECEGSYTINRTFTATDECGLSSSVTQIITVIDTVGPILISAPDDLVIDCEDEVPAPTDVMAMDACDSEVEISGYSEEIVGDMTPEGAMSLCQATTPSNVEDAWSMVLFEEEQGDLTATTLEASFTQYDDEGEGYSAVIEANLQSVQNTSGGWDLTINLVNGMNWDDWSNQDFPTSYKDDLENSEDFYQDWMYFVIESGTLIGWGDFEGTSISLSHAPVNHYYGFQMGTQGANVNTEFGIGGWVHYSGTMYDEETDSIVDVEGSGDLAFDLDCCPTHSVVRTWEFTDCSGNTSSHTQTITFDDLELEEPTQNTNQEIDLVDLKLEELIQIGASPNPMNQKSTILIDSKVNTDATIRLYNLQGILVREIYEGEINSDEVKEILLERRGLPNGIYIIELISVNGTVSSRVVIGEAN